MIEVPNALHVSPYYHTNPDLTRNPYHLSVHLSEHQVHRTDDSDGIRQKGVSHHEVGTGKMGKSWRSNLASVWSVGTVGNKVDTHLTLGGFDGRVGLSWWNRVTLGVKLE